MDAIQIMQRCNGLYVALGASKTADEAQTIMNEMRRLHDGQCLRCSCSEDDPKHHPRSRYPRGVHPPECEYLPRIPKHLQSVQTMPINGWDETAVQQGGTPE